MLPQFFQIGLYASPSCQFLIPPLVGRCDTNYTREIYEPLSFYLIYNLEKYIQPTSCFGTRDAWHPIATKLHLQIEGVTQFLIPKLFDPVPVSEVGGFWQSSGERWGLQFCASNAVAVIIPKFKPNFNLLTFGHLLPAKQRRPVQDFVL